MSDIVSESSRSDLASLRRAWALAGPLRGPAWRGASPFAVRKA